MAIRHLHDLSVVGNVTVATTGVTNNVLLTSTDTSSASAPDLVLYRNALIADSDTLGVLEFQGRNGMVTSSTAPLTYGAIYARVFDASENHTGLTFSANKGNGSGAFVHAVNVSLKGTNNSAEGAMLINPSTEFELPDSNLEVKGSYGITTQSHGSSANWKQAYDNHITGVAVTGTSTKTITLTQRDGGTISANFSDQSGSGGINMTNGANNRIVTAVDLDTINGESGLLFGGSYLEITPGNIATPLQVKRTSASTRQVNLLLSANDGSSTSEGFLGIDSGADLRYGASSNTSTNSLILTEDNTDFVVNSSTNSAIIRLAGGGTNFTSFSIGGLAGAITVNTGTNSLTIGHHDTSSASSVNNSNGTVIQDVTLDTYGHVTALGSVNLDDRYYQKSESDSRYVNVTGDTMTGNLNIGGNLAFTGDDRILNLAKGTTNSEPKLIIGEQDLYGVSFRWNTGAELEFDGFWNSSVTGGRNRDLGSIDVNNRIWYLNNNVKVGNDLFINGDDLYFDGSNTYLRSDNEFRFLTDGGSAQNGRFKGIQVSTSYSGTIPANGILFYTDTNLYRSAANTLRTNDALTVDGVLTVDNKATVDYLELKDQSGTVESNFHIYAWNTELQFTKRNLSTGAWTGTLLALDYTTNNATFANEVSTGGEVYVDANQNDWAFRSTTGSTSNSSGLWFTGTTARLLLRDSSGSIKTMLAANGTNAENVINGNTIWHAGNDGAGTGLDSDLLDGQQGSYYTSASNLFSGTLPIARLPEFIEEKYIYTSNDNNAVYMPMVKGGMYGTTASSVTGQILIKIPSYKTDMMIQFYVDIYEYDTGESMTFRISGYNYSDTNATWYNTSVVNLSDDTDRDFTVRFGADTTNSFQYVTIGETNSTWSYPQVNVRDFFGGYATAESDAQGSFNVSFVTTTPGSVSRTHNNNFVAGDYNNLKNTPTIPTVNNGTLTVQGTGALGGSGTFTANQSGNTTISISHDDVSTQSSINNSNGTVIQDVTLDTYGHVTGLGSVNLDNRYLVKGGSWNASNMPGSRWGGFSVNGGEVVFQRDNPSNGRMSVMVDGQFYAGENGGFYSLYSGNNYNAKSGFYTDSSGNTQFSTAGPYLQNTTPHGYIQLGPMNTSWAHIYTDRPAFYFNKELYVNGNVVWNSGSTGLGGTNRISDLSNANNSVPSGFYQYYNGSNYPTSSTWYNLLNVRHSNTANDHGFQIAASYYNEDIWTRTYQSGSGNNNGTYTTWRRLYHEGHKPTLSELGAAAAGDENIIDGATSIWNADGDGDVFTYNDSNPTHNGDGVGAVINIKGDGTELHSLVRAGIYTGDHVSVSRGYYVGSVLNTSNANTQQVIDSTGNVIVGSDTVPHRTGTITVNGDANTYYPVTWYGAGQSQAYFKKIQIYRNYSETAPSTWNTSTHKGGLLFDLEANWGGWGGVNYDIKVNEFSELYSTMVAKIGHFANSRGFAIWLRGGGAVYHFDTVGCNVDPAVQLSAYDPGNNSTGVSSTTSLDQATITNRLYFRGGTLYSGGNQVLTTASSVGGISQSDADTRYINVTGDTMGGTLNMAGNTLTLHTSGGSPGLKSYYGTVNVVNGSSAGTLYVGTGSANASGSVFATTHGGSSNNKVVYNSSYHSYYVGSSTEEMRLESDGDLHVEGDVTAYSTTVSDIRLKDNVVTIDNALDKVCKLRGVEYTWNRGSRKDTKDLGVIAQEVEKVLPEIVKEKKMPLIDDSDTKYKAVDYEKMTAVLIEAVKEQQAQIDELTTILEQLTKQLNNGNNI